MAEAPLVFLPTRTDVKVGTFSNLEAVALKMDLVDVEGKPVSIIVIFDSEDAANVGDDLVLVASAVAPISEQGATVEADPESQEDASK